MKIKWIWGLASIMFTSAAPLVSAAPRDLSEFPPPHAPFLAAPPANAQWVIVAQPAGKPDTKDQDPPARATGISSIQSIKSGDLKQDIISYASGAKTEVWYFQNYVLTDSVGNSGKVIIQSQAALDDPINSKGAFRLLGNAVRSLGYPGFKWIDKSNYAGMELFDKSVPTYHYVLRGKSPDTNEVIVVAEAWVNAETGAPQAYLTEGTLYVYRFGETPKEKLAMPSNFEAAFSKFRQSLDRQKRLESDAAAGR